MGRPSSYEESVAEEICDRVAAGELITEICEIEGFPTYKTFRRWKAAHEDFAKRIACAREDQMDYYCDKIVRLNATMNAANWQFVNAQIRNTQWLMGKLKAAQYGDKVSAELSGPGGGAIPVSLEIDI